jgi:hypothetical protein
MLVPDSSILRVLRLLDGSPRLTQRAYAYLLTPEGVAAKATLTRQFLARKLEEYDALRLEVERLQRESEKL